MSDEVEIKVYGYTYMIKGGDPDRTERVAEYVDNMMTELLGIPEKGLSARGAVFAALNVADEWFTKKDELDKIILNLNERVDELSGLLPE